MKVVRHKTVREFLRRAEAWLMQAEAENCLILGIAHDMAARGEHAKAEPYLMTIEAEDGVVGAALMTPPHDLLVSGLPAGAAEILAQHTRRAAVDRDQLRDQFRRRLHAQLVEFVTVEFHDRVRYRAWDLPTFEPRPRDARPGRWSSTLAASSWI